MTKILELLMISYAFHFKSSKCTVYFTLLGIGLEASFAIVEGGVSLRVGFEVSKAHTRLILLSHCLKLSDQM